jgi:hypothetical protein
MEIIRDFVVHEIRAGCRKFGVELIYMQDNAPCHKAKKSMALLQSLDLNPIKNLWAIIKHRRADECRMPKTKKELID